MFRPICPIPTAPPHPEKKQDKTDQLDPAHRAKLDEVGPMLPVPPRAPVAARAESIPAPVGRQGLRRVKRSFKGGASSVGEFFFFFFRVMCHFLGPADVSETKKRARSRCDDQVLCSAWHCSGTVKKGIWQEMWCAVVIPTNTGRCCIYVLRVCMNVDCSLSP